PHTTHLDVAGLVTFAGALFLFVLALLRGNEEGWSSALILGLFAGAALLLVAFILVELRQQQPMFDLSLFRSHPFDGVSIATFAIGRGLFAAFPSTPLYLQTLLGYSPLQGAPRVPPATVLVSLPPTPPRRFGPRLRAGLMLGGGMTLIAIGALLMSRLT